MQELIIRMSGTELSDLYFPATRVRTSPATSPEEGSMHITDVVTETVDQARRRMALKARQEGVTITFDSSGEF